MIFKFNLINFFSEMFSTSDTLTEIILTISSAVFGISSAVFGIFFSYLNFHWMHEKSAKMVHVIGVFLVVFSCPKSPDLKKSFCTVEASKYFAFDCLTNKTKQNKTWVVVLRKNFLLIS